MLIDSHCHLHDKEFFSEEEAEVALARAKEAGVEKIICIGTSHEDSLRAQDFAERHDDVYWTYGIHPSEVGRVAETYFFESIKRFDFLEMYIPDDPDRFARVAGGSAGGPAYDISKKSSPTNKKIGSARTRHVAIGEVGLDYHYEGYDRHGQIKLFEKMLQLALDNDLPVSFHVREAFEDFFGVVANFPKIRGVVHSFSDNKKNLKRILNDTDYYVGVNGLATYSTLPLPPLNRILLETDAPFLAPVPHRGEKNEPAYAAEVAKWLAEKLELSVDEIAITTSDNAEKLFSFPEKN